MLQKDVQPLKFKDATLKEILDKIRAGEISLPFFQRNFEWSKKDMKSLLSSLILGLPIGSILLLKDTKNQFDSRPIEGVIEKNNDATEFLLDGQQRLTSLYSIFTLINSSSRPLIRLRWFIDLSLFDQHETDPFYYSFEHHEPEDIVDYIITKQRTKDPSFFSKENSEDFLKACQNEFILPLDIFYSNTDENGESEAEEIRENLYDAVLSERIAYWSARRPEIDKNRRLKMACNWISSVDSYILSLLEKTNILVLTFKHDKFNRAIQAFEILNKSGVKLHIFDLLVARAARETVQIERDPDNNVSAFYHTVRNSYESELPVEDVQKIQKKYNGDPWSLMRFDGNSNFPTKKMKDFLVNILTLHISDLIDTKTISNNFLFGLDDIQKSAKLLNDNIGECMSRLRRTLCFLQTRCGIRQINDIHYKLIILPIAYVMTNETWESEKKIDLIEAWYWQTIFSGHFEYDQSKVALVEIDRLEKVLSGKEPLSTENILERDRDNFSGVYRLYETKFETMKECMPSHGYYKSIQQFVLSSCPRDFFYDETEMRLNSWDTNSAPLQDHHIIPLNSQKTTKEATQSIRSDKKNPLNSILNRILISKKSNQKIGGMSFEQYKKEISKGIFVNHLIGNNIPAMQQENGDNTDLENFLKNRFEKIQSEIIRRIESLSD